jgi:transposase
MLQKLPVPLMGKEKYRKKKTSLQDSREIEAVTFRFKVERRKLDTRKCFSEHPFGTVKRFMDSAYLLLKGKKIIVL